MQLNSNQMKRANPTQKYDLQHEMQKVLYNMKKSINVQGALCILKGNIM